MADLAKTTPPGSNADASAVITFTAADTTVQETAFEEGLLVIAWNSGASGRSVTIKSVADSVSGRVNDITADPIAAGVHRVYGPFKARGWRTSGGKLQFSATHADVKFAFLKRVTA